jgi:transposase, IS6 family
MKHDSKLFKWKHFSGMIIMWSVRWYGRYALSYNDLREIAAERGLKINRSTICRWVHEYGKLLAKLIKPHLKVTCKSWRVDETYIKIKGIWHYLYRAVDREGQTLDWMLSKNRNKEAAKKFFKKTLSNKHIAKPSVINVDKAPAFVPAHLELQKSGELNCIRQ